MLTRKRQEEILKLLQQKGSVTVQELTELFDASESTIRRDLNAMDQEGLLQKVFGGAVLLEAELLTTEMHMDQKNEVNLDQKDKIGQYAASLVSPGDFVYIDAGTTTRAMLPYLKETDATYVTNAMSHALQLSSAGFRVILIGGVVKNSTEAIVGSDAYAIVQKYHFSKGFWGTNAVTRRAGFTTPDTNEAMIKDVTIHHTDKAYVLCDSDKFGKIYPVQFAEYEQAVIITDDGVKAPYRDEKNVIIAGS